MIEISREKLSGAGLNKQTETELKSTEHYTAQLKKIRRKPQNTEKQKIEKREKAREFRMDVMLDNARLMLHLTNQLEYKPWSTANDLKLSTNTIAKYLAHPETAKHFINILIATKERVGKLIKDLGKPTEVAKKIYKYLIKYNKINYQPKGEIEIDLSYPLAIMLYVSDSEDFKMFDHNNNSIGLYSPSAVFDSKRVLSVVPIIVVNGGYETSNKPHEVSRIEEHEKGHAEYEMLVYTLKYTTIENTLFKFPYNSKEVLSKLDGHYQAEKSETDPAKTPEFSIVLNYVLEQAKNEILAEFKAAPDILDKHINQLKLPGGSYDYFANLGINPNSQAYKDLREAYNKHLDEAYNALNFLFNSYSQWSLFTRYEIIRWVMAQIPLKDWGRQINETGFQKEAIMLLELKKEWNKDLESNNGINPKLRKTTEKISENQWLSFIPIIEKYKKRTQKPNQPTK